MTHNVYDDEIHVLDPIEDFFLAIQKEQKGDKPPIVFSKRWRTKNFEQEQLEIRLRLKLRESMKNLTESVKK